MKKKILGQSLEIINNGCWGLGITNIKIDVNFIHLMNSTIAKLNLKSIQVFLLILTCLIYYMQMSTYSRLKNHYRVIMSRSVKIQPYTFFLYNPIFYFSAFLNLIFIYFNCNETILNLLCVMSDLRWFGKRISIR